MLSDKELLKKFNKDKDKAKYNLSLQMDYARRAQRFYSGDQGVYTAEVTSTTGDKQVIVFNKVMAYVDAVSGLMRQLRRNAEYCARVENDAEQQELSLTLNAGAAYLRENCNADFYESAQDKDTLICGFSGIDTNISYETNPDGATVEEVIPYNELWWDPESTAPNLLDARFIGRDKKYTIEEAEARFSTFNETDFDSVDDQLKQKISNPFDGEYTAISVNNSNNDDLVQISYYQWWELDKYYRANNPLLELDPDLAKRMIDLLEIVKENTAEEYEPKKEEVEDIDDIFEFDPTAETWSMTGKIKNSVVAALKEFGIGVETQEYLRRCYYTAILSETKVYTKFKSQNQEGFTIKVKTGNYDTELKLWYGMVRQLQEPSRYANKALTEILYTIAFNSKGGVLYERMAVDDPQRFERQYASTQAAIQVNDGALSGGAIQPKAQAYLPTGYENVYSISNESMGQVTGINKEFLGSSENKQVSALMESQRINQATAVLANYFDSISLFQIEHARLMLTFMAVLSENKPRIINTVGKDGKNKNVTMRKELFMKEYDIKIAESLPSNAQQAETGQILLGISQQAALMGKDILPVVIDYIPGIKFADKQRLQEILSPQPSPEQIQMQQQVKAIEFEAQKAKIQKDIADAEYKFASIDREKADTTRTLAEAEQRAIENQLIKRVPLDSINVSV